MKHLYKYLFVFFWFCVPNILLLGQQTGWSTDYVYYGKGGKLTYTPDDQGNIIPDFSNVGYQYGDTDIPDIPVKVEVSPVDGDDGATIQAAIESLYDVTPDANGFRGAVLLKAGTYEIAGQLTINKSGIVLRGEGQDNNGTVLIATGTGDRVLVDISTSASLVTDKATKATVAEDFVPLGRKYVVVGDASAYSAGDDIALYRPGTDNWISDLKMDQISDDSDGLPSTQWSASSYSFYFERKATRVNGDTIFFRNPVVMALDKHYGGGHVYKSSYNRLENIGIENMCFKSEYASETDEDHAWTAVEFDNVENGWARDLTSWYFAYSCVSVERGARLISVLDCSCFEPKSIITGGRRYSFYCTGQLNLFKGCQTTEGRHDYVTGSGVCGPNVFTQCTARNAHNDIGPHHRWAMGTLFDVINTDGEINVQDRDNMGTGHGWSGANQVFWNCSASSSICQSPWVSAKNYNFGFQGEKAPGYRPDRPDGVWVGHNQPGLFPASLYEAQLDERLNGTVVFSASSSLEAVNDSTFVMSFNLPVNQTDIIPANFTIAGTAGVENKLNSIESRDVYSVTLKFSGLGILPSLSTIVITADVQSESGLSLTGLKISTYVEPDKRPVVSGPALTVTNEKGSFIVAQSTKTGYVYLIRLGEPNASIEDFENDIANHNGAKAQITTPDVSVPVYTEGLRGGVYYLFATDEVGRISEAAENLIYIEEVNPVAVNPEYLNNNFKVIVQSNSLQIIPDNFSEVYNVFIYDLNGRLYASKASIKGNHQISLRESQGLLIVKIVADTGLFMKKIAVIR